jgi:phage terminase Nu1 subunit (DNA packaging protein)
MTVNNYTEGHVRKGEMASIMGVSIRTIESWMAKRIIPYHKINRVVTFDPLMVKEAIQSRFTVQPGGEA